MSFVLGRYKGICPCALSHSFRAIVAVHKKVQNKNRHLQPFRRMFGELVLSDFPWPSLKGRRPQYRHSTEYFRKDLFIQRNIQQLFSFNWRNILQFELNSQYFDCQKIHKKQLYWIITELTLLLQYHFSFIHNFENIFEDLLKDFEQPNTLNFHLPIHMFYGPKAIFVINLFFQSSIFPISILVACGCGASKENISRR